jgi:hypothetical protein
MIMDDIKWEIPDVTYSVTDMVDELGKLTGRAPSADGCNPYVKSFETLWDDKPPHKVRVDVLSWVYYSAHRGPWIMRRTAIITSERSSVGDGGSSMSEEKWAVRLPSAYLHKKDDDAELPMQAIDIAVNAAINGLLAYAHRYEEFQRTPEDTTRM